MIRAILPSDGLTLKTVRLRALREAPNAFSQTLGDAEGEADEQWIARAEELASASGDARVFLAFGVDEAPVGMAGGYLHRERAAEAVVWGVWVEPALRGNGLGRELVEAVIAWAVSRHCSCVTLCVSETSEPAAALYRALGFEEMGTPRPHPHVAGSTEVSMVRRLAPGGAATNG